MGHVAWNHRERNHSYKFPVLQICHEQMVNYFFQKETFFSFGLNLGRNIVIEANYFYTISYSFYRFCQETSHVILRYFTYHTCG